MYTILISDLEKSINCKSCKLIRRVTLIISQQLLRYPVDLVLGLVVLRQFANVLLPGAAVLPFVQVYPRRRVVLQLQAPSVSDDVLLRVVLHRPGAGGPDPEQPRVESARPVTLVFGLFVALQKRYYVLVLLNRLELDQVAAHAPAPAGRSLPVQVPGAEVVTELTHSREVLRTRVCKKIRSFNFSVRSLGKNESTHLWICCCRL